MFLYSVVMSFGVIMTYLTYQLWSYHTNHQVSILDKIGCTVIAIGCYYFGDAIIFITNHSPIDEPYKIPVVGQLSIGVFLTIVSYRAFMLCIANKKRELVFKGISIS